MGVLKQFKKLSIQRKVDFLMFGSLVPEVDLVIGDGFVFSNNVCGPDFLAETFGVLKEK